MLPCPSGIADGLPAGGLSGAELLLERVDRKYVVEVERLEALVDRLRGTHAALEIDGRRGFAYETTYFDTPELRAFRDHVQQRRRRFKCRTREYLDSGVCNFEVKLKGSRGLTVKHRMPYERELRDRVSAPALAFLRDCLHRAYGHAHAEELLPSLVVACTRLTLVAAGERVTCDFDLRFSAPGGAGGRLADGTAIVETKSATGDAEADRVLRRLGARPEAVCSKYCLGVGLTHPNVRRNTLLPLLRRHFEAT